VAGVPKNEEPEESVEKYLNQPTQDYSYKNPGTAFACTPRLLQRMQKLTYFMINYYLAYILLMN
jgi:hypothetical protein